MTYEEARAEMLARCAAGEWKASNLVQDCWHGHNLSNVDLWYTTFEFSHNRRTREYKLADITLDQFKELIQSGNA